VTTRPPETTGPAKGPPTLQLAFVGVLLLIGVGFLAVAGYRAWRPRTTPDLAARAEADLERRGFQPLSEPLQRLLDDKGYKPVPTQPHPLLSLTAPDFTLDGVDGKPWRLADALAKGPVVLVFYYGYHCDHCVSQLFALNKDVAKFRELGVTVVAVSGDAPELTRQRFKKYGAFAFAVLSDPDNKTAQAYGVYRPGKNGQEGDLMHGTFVISRTGKVVWANSGDEPFTEDRTLLLEAAKLKNRIDPTKGDGKR
jgi:peroxiredoxin Q/BCP